MLHTHTPLLGFIYVPSSLTRVCDYPAATFTAAAAPPQGFRMRSSSSTKSILYNMMRPKRQSQRHKTLYYICTFVSIYLSDSLAGCRTPSAISGGALPRKLPFYTRQYNEKNFVVSHVNNIENNKERNNKLVDMLRKKLYFYPLYNKLNEIN